MLLISVQSLENKNQGKPLFFIWALPSAALSALSFAALHSQKDAAAIANATPS